MKKFTLLTSVFVLVAGMAWSQFHAIRVPENMVNIKDKMPLILPDVNGGATIADIVPGQKSILDDMIGNTWYDLQSYYTLQKRIYAYDDGTIGVTYMRANDVGVWSERGSAYNYYDGNAWGPSPTGRIESVRTGWPSYVPYGPTGEIVVSHSVIQAMGLIFNKREVKGQGAWQEFYLPGPSGYDLVWPAMVTNGPDRMNIHLLAVTYGDPYEGMASALLYYRSTDGGQSWDIQHQLMDELNSNYFSTIDGDNYSWAEPRGDTLAFTVGFSTEDGYVMKSFDNGETWEQIVVLDSPYTPYTGGATPPFCGGDGTQSCALDSQGNVHVVFGRMRHYFDDAGVGYYYPVTEGIVYWNESMPALDTTTMSTITLDYLIEGGNLIGWIAPNQGDSTIIGYGIYYTSLTSHPQINIDENDNLYVIWAGLAPGYDNFEQNYRHIFGNGSNDGGQHWTGIKDLTTDLTYIFSECMYPVMSQNFAGNMVHMTFLTDGLPGIAIWTEEHGAVENMLNYQGRDIDEFIVGVKEQGAKGEELRVQVYPNPFRDVLYLKVSGSDGNVLKDKELQVRVMDLTGRIIIGFTSDNEIIEIDGSGWDTGIYLVLINTSEGVKAVKVLKE